MCHSSTCHFFVLFLGVLPQLGETPTALGAPQSVAEKRQAVAVGEGPMASGGSGGGAGDEELDDLQARLDRLRKD